jgi:hypothetical protein
MSVGVEVTLSILLKAGEKNNLFSKFSLKPLQVCGRNIPDYARILLTYVEIIFRIATVNHVHVRYAEQLNVAVFRVISPYLFL